MLALLDNFTDLIQRGGWVMIPLLAMSILSVTLVVERAFFWVRVNGTRGHSQYNKLLLAFASSDRAKLIASTNSAKSVFARVANQIARNPNSATAIAAVEETRPRLERFMVTLSTIITAAPLLGILGTVFGIIQSFDLLGQDQTLLDPRTVSAGIAEALITTAMGLIVALITLFPYMVFKGQLDRTLGRLEAIIAAGLAADTANPIDSPNPTKTAAETSAR